MAPVSVFLTREQMLAAKGRKFGEVELPELGGKVHIATFSAKAALELRELQTLQEKGENVERRVTALMLREGIVDENGKQIFDAKSLEQFLEGISPETAAQLVQAISKLLAPPKKEPGAPENPEGNSQASPSGS